MPGHFRVLEANDQSISREGRLVHLLEPVDAVLLETESVIPLLIEK